MRRSSSMSCMTSRIRGMLCTDDPLGGQQRGAEYLQRFVLGALGRDAAVEPVAAFDFENRHNP